MCRHLQNKHTCLYHCRHRLPSLFYKCISVHALDLWLRHCFVCTFDRTVSRVRLSRRTKIQSRVSSCCAQVFACKSKRMGSCRLAPVKVLQVMSPTQFYRLTTHCVGYTPVATGTTQGGRLGLTRWAPSQTQTGRSSGYLFRSDWGFWELLELGPCSSFVKKMES